MPIFKQGGIKYHFLNLWYDFTWDWTPLLRLLTSTSGFSNIKAEKSKTVNEEYHLGVGFDDAFKADNILSIWIGDKSNGWVDG